MAEQTFCNRRNIVAKLFKREIHGSDRCHRKARPQKLFQKIPKRLCFRLSSLVPELILEEGYVFLGFTKCGQYVVSYTCQMDTINEDTTLPFYQYKLQWWWFVPSRPLVKVSEIGLFGAEDIVQDLYILFCEWPEDKSQVLIFGQSLPGQGQESCQCYFTITAVPVLAPCKHCSDLKTGSDDKTLCLKHSFCFHSKYELTQPFPLFSPRIQLKCDGQVILNTGDSIVALHVDLDHVDSKPKGLFGENASVLKVRESTSADKNKDLCVSPEPNKEFVWSGNGAVIVTSGQDGFAQQEGTIEGSPNQKVVESTDVIGEEICDPESQKENTSNNTLEVKLDRIKSPKSPKNLLSQNQKSPTHPLSPAEKWLECRNITYPTSPPQPIASQQNVRRAARAGSSNTEGPLAKDLYNFDSDDSEDSCSFMCPNVPRFSLKSKSNSQDINISYPPNPVISPNMHLQRQIMQGLARSSPLNNNSQALNCLPIESPSVLAARNHPAIQRSFFSPSNSENSFGGTSSSADSVIVQVNDSRTVTHSWRKFSYHGDTDVDSTLVIEGRSSPLNNNSQALNCLPIESPSVLAARNHPAIQRSFFSPSNSENSFGGTSSSADSVIVQVNDSRTVTHSWRKFSYHGDTDVDSTLVIEARSSPLNNNSQALNCLPIESPSVLAARNHPAIQRSFFSPSNSENSFGGTSSSADSVIVQVNDSRTVTHSWRKFSYHGDTDVDSTLVIEENTSCCSPLNNNSQALNCLPIESPSVLSARNHPAIQRSFFSPSNSENSFGGTSSSADSVIVQVNDSRTVTHSWRKFSYHGDTDVDSTLVIEDDFDLSYRSVLPAEVRGTKNRQLALSSDPSNDGNKEQICIKQLTFDVEHYMEETIRSSAKWGDRYVAFTNYDLQILEVLSDRQEVLAKVFALISAKDVVDKKKVTRKSKAQDRIRVYQTDFTFELNMQSGTYETLHIDDLKLIDQRLVLSKDWKPGSRECVTLRKYSCIPQSPRCVHVLSNESVFRGKSLPMILHPEQFTAIIL